MERERIIGLPAFLGGGFDLAGIKWIASFPGNLARGIDRASAVMVLNSMQTGRPETLLEASIVSAKRTAASAALAGATLLGERKPGKTTLIGCGLISFEILRFLVAAVGELGEVTVFDLDTARARQFADHAKARLDLDLTVAEDLPSALSGTDLLALATTAVKPHVDSLAPTREDAVVLHVSLRDFTPAVILGADNVVDDVDHVLRAQTSVHLAEQEVGHRDFIRCTLADLLLGQAPAPPAGPVRTIFSPFGLGVLDLAVAQLAREIAVSEERGTVIDSFLPPSWTEWP
jgi:ornithine cyclodeaminase